MQCKIVNFFFFLLLPKYLLVLEEGIYAYEISGTLEVQLSHLLHLFYTHCVVSCNFTVSIEEAEN